MGTDGRYFEMSLAVKPDWEKATIDFRPRFSAARQADSEIASGKLEVFG